LLKLKELEEQGIQDQVAHILQVNVLGKSRGRGNAQALLEATLWDTEQNKNVAFTYAEVLTTNEDSGAAMIKAFIKAGFEPFFVKEQHSHSSYRPAYYLFVKENPDFEKTQQSRNRFARN
jgi:ribosomal protein S18 acetylase RimI-like enzyme